MPDTSLSSTDLFASSDPSEDGINAQDRPLPEQLRPKQLSDVVGQDHLLGPDGILTRMQKGARVPSLLLWGPPGVGKTTLARLLAQDSGLHFEQISAIFTGVADLRRVFDSAKVRRKKSGSTLLFVDEIHRFNKAQQDAFLPVVEDGTITLIGATTENPSFEMNAALLSRLQVVVLKRLSEQALEQLLQRAEAYYGRPLPLDDTARSTLKAIADGDGRYLLGMAEHIMDDGNPMDEQRMMTVVSRRRPLYDKAEEGHYNLISALHKSVRGSDVDAALYWFARMLAGGEDPRFIARRFTRMATEDIGLADPQALPICIAAWEAYERMGSPEGELALSQALIYLACAPKSNANYVAYKSAIEAAEQNGSLMPPMHILNAPTKMMKEMGYGHGYHYDHDAPDAFSGQNYFPDAMNRPVYYNPPERGFEREIRKRLDYWARLRDSRKNSE